MVGEGCHLGEQVNLKASVIGAGCKVREREVSSGGLLAINSNRAPLAPMLRPFFSVVTDIHHTSHTRPFSHILMQPTQIGTRVKIHQCVLMDNVTVQDNVTLQGTVVSPHAVVQVRMCAVRALWYARIQQASVSVYVCALVLLHIPGHEHTHTRTHVHNTPTGVLLPDGRVRGLLRDGAAPHQAEGRGADAGVRHQRETWLFGSKGLGLERGCKCHFCRKAEGPLHKREMKDRYPVPPSEWFFPQYVRFHSFFLSFSVRFYSLLVKVQSPSHNHGVANVP